MTYLHQSVFASSTLEVEAEVVEGLEVLVAEDVTLAGTHGVGADPLSTVTFTVNRKSAVSFSFVCSFVFVIF